jgi:D-aminopeptidase
VYFLDYTIYRYIWFPQESVCMSAKPRLRDLGICVGRLPTGRHNAITDVPGVRVGHSTVIYDEPEVARTGVTIIAPREGPVREDHVFGGYYSFNGCGAMTGLLWLEESGQLSSEIALTGTYTVGSVYDALVQATTEKGYGYGSQLPVVGETYDGFLNQGPAFHVTVDHVFEALNNAKSGPVEEGNVGGGTGMKCHDFKGGIGTASRRVTTAFGNFTVGALVQANQGERADLTIAGVPVGQEIGSDKVPTLKKATPIETAPAETEPQSSIIVVLATDAPLLPFQCKRLAQRATIGLARTGSYGQNWSGDIFLAFTTANHIWPNPTTPECVEMLPNEQMDPLFLAAAESVEESILNALCAAETMTGHKGATIHALPQDELVQVMQRYGRIQ